MGGGEGRRGGAETPEPRPAPQWLLDALRPAIRGLSRALWRIAFRGLEHIPAEGGLVIAANHQTYVDPFWVGSRVNRPVRYLAWNEAFKWPVMGKVLEWLGAWPIVLDRGNPTAHLNSNKSRAADALLSVTDAKSKNAKSALVRSTYEKLRGSAKKHVEDAVPRLGKLLEKHAK